MVTARVKLDFKLFDINHLNVVFVMVRAANTLSLSLSSIVIKLNLMLEC